MRRAAKVDGNAPAIVQALQDLGVSVYTIGRPVDLLCGFRGRNYLLEVKQVKARPRKDQEKQRQFIQAWAGEIVTVRTAEDALRAIGALPAPVHICQQPGFDARFHRCLGCRCEGDGVPLHGSHDTTDRGG